MALVFQHSLQKDQVQLQESLEGHDNLMSGHLYNDLMIQVDNDLDLKITIKKLVKSKTIN